MQTTFSLFESCCLFSEPIPGTSYLSFYYIFRNATCIGQIFNNFWGRTPHPLNIVSDTVTPNQMLIGHPDMHRGCALWSCWPPIFWISPCQDWLGLKSIVYQSRGDPWEPRKCSILQLGCGSVRGQAAQGRMNHPDQNPANLFVDQVYRNLVIRFPGWVP